MRKYKVKEIFGPTIQGEGSKVGEVVLFLRFSGCNKWNGKAENKPSSICSFCDTDFVGGEFMTSEEILEKLNSLSSCRKVVISGGEPTLQIDLDLLKALKGDGYEIHIETNGSRYLPGQITELIDHITMSPKQRVEYTKLAYCHDLKILYPPIDKNITLENFDNFKADEKYLQPVMRIDYNKNLEKTLIKLYENPQWKLSLQVHKIIEVE